MTTFEIIFYALNLVIAPAWALLILAPNSLLTARFVHSAFLPLVLGTFYSTLLFSGIFLGQSAPDAGMASLSAIGALFSHPVGLLTGWVHFLAFDLFIGAWIARDAKTLGFSHLSTLPALLFALMFGPIGLMIHLLRRGLSGHGWRF